MRIVVSKTGSAWHLDRKIASPVGEQRDATGIAFGLRAAGHDVCLLGRLRGELEGFHHVDWCVKGSYVYDDHADAAVEEYERVLREVRDWSPDAIVNSVGACPTCSWVRNDRAVRVQDFAAKYVAPLLYVYWKTGLPRVCVINDPRSYPRDHEMLDWPACKPRAVLSQENNVIRRRVLRKTYDIHAAYAGCENWWSFDEPPRPEANTGEVPMLIIAHSHMRDKRLEKLRDEVWSWILRDVDDYVIYGRGWEDFSGYNPERMPGPVHPDEVFPKLRTGVCGPMIPISDGFITGKLRQYLVSGCLPLPYGRGDEYLTYDRQEHHVPLSHELRFVDSQGLGALVRRAAVEPDWRRGHVDRLLERTTPNFQKLLDCVEYFADRDAAPRFSEFGGYERC